MGVDVASLYVRYAPLVYRRCLRLLKSEAEAEDAMQDVFVRVIGRATELTDTGLSSLLFQMATQVSLNRLRTRKRRPETSDEAQLAALAERGARVDRVHAAHWLGWLFAHERPDTASMAVMHFVDGMTLDEVAAASGLSVSGVRKRLRGLAARAHADEASPESLPPRDEAPAHEPCGRAKGLGRALWTRASTRCALTRDPHARSGRASRHRPAPASWKRG